MTLRERLDAALARPAPELLPGDFHGEEPPDARTPAAVLVAVVDRTAPTLLLTRRTDTLSNHPGQVAFPGGRADPGDDGPVGTALREAEEEVGLSPATVDVVGPADPYRTGSGFCIVPVLGVIPPDLRLRPHEREVAELFEVPLDFVLDAANHVVRTGEWRGRTRRYYEISWQGRSIWGATAAIIVNLGRRLG